MKLNSNLFSLNLKTHHIVILSVLIELILFYFYYFPDVKILTGDEKRYFRYAERISNGGEWQVSPTWPPLQYLIMSIFFKIFNYSLIPIQLFQYALLISSGFILKNIVYKETNDIRSSNIALAIMILYPSWLAYSQYLWPEITHVFLFVSVIWIVNYRSYSKVWIIITGVLIGLMLLLKGFIVFFIPFFFIPYFYKYKISSAILKTGLCCIFIAIVIAPASFKTHKLSGGFLPSNSSMYNLWLGLNMETRSLSSPSNEHIQKLIKYKNYLLLADNYRDRNSKIKSMSIEKITKQGIFETLKKQLSKQYFRLLDYNSTLHRQFNNGYHHNTTETPVLLFLTFDTIFYVVTIITLFMGLIISYKNSILSKQFAIFVLYIFALFLLINSKPRFRIPLVPISAYFTGCLYYYLKIKNYKFNMIIQNKKQFLIVIFIVISVLFLIFAGVYLDEIMPL